MTRKLSRNYSRSVIPFVIALIAFVAPAQTPGGGQRSAQHAIAPARQDNGAPAQAVLPLPLPDAGNSGSASEIRSHKSKHGAGPMDGNPLFLPAVTYSTGGQTAGVAVADLNGDGRPDLIVTNVDNGTVGVLLGNGDGTFQPAVTYGSGGSEPFSVAVADVNGDGHPDLVVANSYSGNVAVLLGNGDGTFQTAVSYNSGGNAPYSVKISDLNGDGHPDLVVSNICCIDGLYGVVAVLLGNGDGTFQTPVTYSSGGGYADSIAISDLTGNGKPDIVVSNQCQDQHCNSFLGLVGVLLGNGDGTFQPAVTYSSGGYQPFSVAAGDVNGDGHPDLLLVNSGSNTVGVLLNNGDGTFQPVVTYGTGGVDSWSTQSVTAADVNGDGHADLLVANCYSNDVGVLLGNGDGTFQPAVFYGSGGWDAWSVAVADVNGDGWPDLMVTNALWETVGVLLNDAGPKGPTETTLRSSLNPSVFGQLVTFTAQVSSSAGKPTGTVIFYDGSNQIGSATLANGSASFSTSALAAGSHSIAAAYQGSADFNPSQSTPLNQVVNTATTATSLASSLNPALVNELVTYTATVAGQYGGAVTGTVVFRDGGSTVATVTMVGNQAAYSTKYKVAGVQAMTATYSGDTDNTGSVSATLVEQINKGISTRTVLTTSGSPSQINQPVTFTATVRPRKEAIPDGELVTFYDGKTVIGTGATASGVATFTTSSLKAKTHTIKATYPGDDTFEPSSGSVKQVVDK
jgi:hypothetical protein